MKCPSCGFIESKVIDSRPADEGEKIRRRRECLKCSFRFTTYEMIESLPIIVIKKDKSREIFDRTKLMNGILKACEKRPISLDLIEKSVNEVEAKIHNLMVKEINSGDIGEYVMQALKNVDKVAYVRFASVYREFDDVSSFMDELRRLVADKK